MALGSRYRTATGVGTLAALALVLVFGSPWFSDGVGGDADPSTAGGHWLRTLAWPQWRFDSGDSLQGLLQADLRAILVVVLTAVFLTLLPASGSSRARGTLGQFFAGWGAYVFAGAFAALLTTLFLPGPSLLAAVQAASAGGTYGLLIGGIVGLAAVIGRRGPSRGAH